MKWFCTILFFCIIVTELYALGEEPQLPANETISIRFVYEKPLSLEAKGPAPFLDWFRSKNSTVLLYKNADAYYGFSPPSLLTNLPEWLKSRPEGVYEQCSTEDGMKYAYKGAGSGTTLEIKVAAFDQKNGWERQVYNLEDFHQFLGCSFSRDGRYLAISGRHTGNELEVVELLAACKNNCLPGKKLWNSSFFGFRLQPSGERLMIFSGEGAYLVMAKTAKVERTFSFSSPIQRALNSFNRVVQGKNYTISRRAEIDPEGHYVVLIDSCIESKCPSELNQVQLRDFRTGMLIYAFKGISGRVERARFSWDGKYLAFSTNKGQIVAVEILSEKKPKTPTPSTKT